MTDAPPPWVKQACFTVDGIGKHPDMVIISLYVEPMEWAKPMEDAPAPN